MLTSAIFTYQILDEGGNGGRHRWNYATLVLAPHLYRAKESNFGKSENFSVFYIKNFYEINISFLINNNPHQPNKYH